jgi:hypothetical protein
MSERKEKVNESTMATFAPKSSDSDPKSMDSAEAEHGTMYDETTNFGVDEKKLVRKLDVHLIPLIMLLCESKSGLRLFSAISLAELGG